MEISIKNIKLTGALLFLAFIYQGCEDFVNVDAPAKELSPEIVFSNEGTATGAVVGLYTWLANLGYDASFQTGLSSDELLSVSTYADQLQFFENQLLANNSFVTRTWNDAYRAINHANVILENLENNSALDPDVKSQLLGETRFLRAYSYFYLVNLFGDVPIVTTTNYRISSIEPRGTVEEVYSLILDDLQVSKEYLTDEYLNVERVRVNRAAASALLARVYLYLEKWELAEAEASVLINNTSLYQLNTDLNKIVLANNTEAILQFFPFSPYVNSPDGVNFIPLFGTFTLSGTYLDDKLLNAFEEGDQRLASWVGTVSEGDQTYYYAFKYKIISSEPQTEYPTVLRLGEQYLIRSEARARQLNISGSQEDLNIIRTRAGLPATTADDAEELLLAIEHERRIELFVEGGHRWFDLKRMKRAEQVLADKSGWQSTDLLFPIPQKDLLNNPNMIQNPGY